MCNRSAIHCRDIGVCRRSSRASSAFPGSPLGRLFNSGSLHWLADHHSLTSRPASCSSVSRRSRACSSRRSIVRPLQATRKQVGRCGNRNYHSWRSCGCREVLELGDIQIWDAGSIEHRRGRQDGIRSSCIRLGGWLPGIRSGRLCPGGCRIQHGRNFPEPGGTDAPRQARRRIGGRRRFQRTVGEPRTVSCGGAIPERSAGGRTAFAIALPAPAGHAASDRCIGAAANATPPPLAAVASPRRVRTKPS